MIMTVSASTSMTPQKVATLPTALLMSSFVSASRVGASASSFCLRRLGVETLVLPTVLLGRHPGWGTPGGGPVQAAQLESMWNGIQAQNLKIDAVMTGYIASPEQAELAARIINAVKSRNPDALILVDPVMGDHGRLYIPEETAQAIRDIVLPLADICTPNIWELGYLTGQFAQNAREACAAAAALPSSTLITSVPFGSDIGAVLNRPATSPIFVSHTRFKSVPNGGGDALAGTFLAHRLNGKSDRDALSRAVGSIFEIISKTADSTTGEMPLIRHQDALIDAAPLKTQDLL